MTFPFALESEQPADQFGYFSLDKELQESPTVATWTANGSLLLVNEPYYGPDGTMIDADHRYEGANTEQFRGTARVALSYALGNRATGTIEMQFKNGMLGRKDEDLAVKVNQYNFQVFGFTGSSLKFGKYLFAAPTDGLAINETGEGATVRFRWFGLSHILKREGVAGAADPNDDDHKVWLGLVAITQLLRALRDRQHARSRAPLRDAGRRSAVRHSESVSHRHRRVLSQPLAAARRQPGARSRRLGVARSCVEELVRRQQGAAHAGHDGRRRHRRSDGNQ